MIPGFRLLKGQASRLPEPLQNVLRRLRYRWLIRTQRFGADEPEFNRLAEWVGEGNWVVDVGANIGNYTLELSRLVGPTGRVIAVEPLPATFHILARHVALARCNNVTLLNVAASNGFSECGMTTPYFDSGLRNPYQSKLSDDGESTVLAIALDGLGVEAPVRLVKIDVEGHEMDVLRGMEGLIKRCHPILIVEGDRQEFVEFLAPFGYTRHVLAASPNTLFLPRLAPGQAAATA